MEKQRLGIPVTNGLSQLLLQCLFTVVIDEARSVYPSSNVVLQAGTSRGRPTDIQMANFILISCSSDSNIKGTYLTLNMFFQSDELIISQLITIPHPHHICQNTIWLDCTLSNKRSKNQLNQRHLLACDSFSFYKNIFQRSAHLIFSATEQALIYF